MTEKTEKLLKSLLIPSSFLVMLWVILGTSYAFNLDLSMYGVHPRTLSGLIGIVTAPLIHGGFTHLASNSLPLLVTGIAILYFYPNAAYKVFGIIYFLSGLMVWLFARSLYHIGASGLIYGFVSFLFFSGIFRRDNRSIALALLVTFLYGGFIWGVLPGMVGISWESHLFGAFTGILCAYIFRKTDPYRKYDWEDEEDDNDRPEKLEVSYDRDR